MDLTNCGVGAGSNRGRELRSSVKLFHDACHRRLKVSDIPDAQSSAEVTIVAQRKGRREEWLAKINGGRKSLRVSRLFRSGKSWFRKPILRAKRISSSKNWR